MLLEERQHISNYATLRAPVGICVPKPVVLLGFVHNAKLIQLVRERMFEYTWSQIASLRDQSNLKPRSVFRLSAYCGIIDSRKKLSLNRAVSLESITNFPPSRCAGRST